MAGARCTTTPPDAAAAVRCPLCGDVDAPHLLDDPPRVYHRCTTCDLVFVHPDAHPRPLDEVLRYMTHRNVRDDPGYLVFLRRLGDPVCTRVAEGQRGLDFGCGPVPVLAEWLSGQRRPTGAYDPLFHPDERLLHAPYDFVTCTEVVEHAHDPAAMFAQLARLVRPGGLLAVMTRFHRDDTPFAQWWYRRDPTHVCFYSAATMQWIAARRSWALELPVPDVALFRVPR